ncbi:MAG: response regulator [Planctomycetes bacterium]|nr:response regulator [Planctomycetota bacterium]
MSVTAFASAEEALSHIDELAIDLAIVDRIPHDPEVEHLVSRLLDRPDAASTHILLLDRSPGEGWTPDDARITSISSMEEVQAFIQRSQDRQTSETRNTPEPGSAGIASTKRACVLVIDDSPTFRVAIRAMLAGRWDVVEAELGSQALPLLQAHAIDALLLDNGLPDSSGIDICRQIRSRMEYATLPIIMLTGSDREESVLSAFEAGADDYVVKGGSSVTLLARLGSHIRRYRTEIAARTAHANLRQSEIVSDARRDLLAVVERKTDELQRANDGLERFAALASHDLQAPLRLITSYLGILSARATVLDDRLRSYLDHAIKASSDAGLLVNRLLHYARSGWTDTTKDSIGDSGQIAGSAVSTFAQTLVETGGAIEVRPLLDVLCDPLCLRQVFENLLGNALKYRSPEPPRIIMGCVADGGLVRFTITDNGMGVPEKDRSRIFDMFHRLHGADIPGMGIGLSLCLKIIEARGGAMGCDPAPGSGSVFWFTLPAAVPTSFVPGQAVA